MTEPSQPRGSESEREPFDLDVDAHARLVEDLRALDDVDIDVPLAVDTVILDEARERISSPVVRMERSGASRGASSGAGRWVAAAAAAVVGVCLWIGWPASESVPVFADPADVDGSGSVDILDAFAIARGIDAARQSGGPRGGPRGSSSNDARLDFNSDGVVDHEDVKALVALVVHVEPRRKGTR